MYIAVKRSGKITISTKYWFRVNYIIPDFLVEPDEIWEKILKPVAGEIGRTYIRSEEGNYVYLHKLNKQQTQDVFDKILSKISNLQIERHWEYTWDATDAVLPSALYEREKDE